MIFMKWGVEIADVEFYVCGIENKEIYFSEDPIEAIEVEDKTVAEFYLWANNCYRIPDEKYEEILQKRISVIKKEAN